MTQHLERTIDHAINLVRAIVAAEPDDAQAQRKFREAAALLHAAADAVELATRVDREAHAG